MILYSHRLDEENPGDWYASPRHYFDLGEHTTIDVDRRAEVDVDIHRLNIAGGGAIFSGTKWAKQNLDIKKDSYAQYNVVWGAGALLRKESIVIALEQYDKVGIRNYQESYPSDKIEFLPCASCMHPVFDKEYTVTDPVGLIRHFKRELPYIPGPKKFGMKEHNKIRNKPQTIEDIVAFIGRHETIITNSYHAAYWSMLMNKRTICYVPNDTQDDKLLTFEISPIIYDDSGFDGSLLKKDYNYKNLLQRYRERNKVFYERVKVLYTR